MSVDQRNRIPCVLFRESAAQCTVDARQEVDNLVGRGTVAHRFACTLAGGLAMSMEVGRRRVARSMAAYPKECGLRPVGISSRVAYNLARVRSAAPRASLMPLEMPLG